MRAAAIVLSLVLLLGGCGGIRVVGLVNTGAPFLFAAQIVQPATTTIVLAPGSSVIVIVELLPVNGLFLNGNQFVSAFNGANPNLVFCPSVVNVVNDGLFAPPGTFLTSPSIGLTLLPVGSGFCSIPINLGQSGTVILNVSVR